MNKRQVAIPALLKIESNVTSHIGIFLKNSGFDKVVILFGNGLTGMFGDAVFTSLKQNNIKVLHSQEMDTIEIDEVAKLAYALPNDAQAIIGMGGGKVIDAAKYIGYLLNIPFISMPTSASSDGFSSSTASLIVKGRRKSIPTVMPYGILVDTDTVKSAPRKFLYSGIGDMVAKISSNYDWQHEEDGGYTEVDDCAYMISKKAVNSFVHAPFDDIESELLLKELLDSLAMGGIANEIAGSSIPSSGSEHMISHALDSILETPQLHGIQVGVATYIMCKIENHRHERVDEIFTKTGFWDYCETLDMKRDDFARAIDIAPIIKPGRHAYIQEEEYREKAKALLFEDERLKRILK